MASTGVADARMDAAATVATDAPSACRRASSRAMSSRASTASFASFVPAHVTRPSRALAPRDALFAPCLVARLVEDVILDRLVVSRCDAARARVDVDVVIGAF